MEKRHTIQKELVLNAVRSMRSHVTAEEVYNFIKNDYPSIGKGTVYRNLNSLSEDGEILKIEIPNGPDRFDFTLEKHYHIRCMRCGNVYDVDMEILPDLTNRILNTHGMQILDYDILFKGLCKQCQNL